MRSCINGSRDRYSWICLPPISHLRASLHFRENVSFKGQACDGSRLVEERCLWSDRRLLAQHVVKITRVVFRAHQPSPRPLLDFAAVDAVEVLHYHHLLHCPFPHLVRHWRDMCEKPQDGDVPECSCTCEAKSLVVLERLFTRNYVCVKEAKGLCV